MHNAAQAARFSVPNTTELKYPLSEWVLYVMHGDTSRSYTTNPSVYFTKPFQPPAPVVIPDTVTMFYANESEAHWTLSPEQSAGLCEWLQNNVGEPDTIS